MSSSSIAQLAIQDAANRLNAHHNAPDAWGPHVFHAPSDSTSRFVYTLTAVTDESLFVHCAA